MTSFNSIDHARALVTCTQKFLAYRYNKDGIIIYKFLAGFAISASTTCMCTGNQLR